MFPFETQQQSGACATASSSPQLDIAEMAEARLRKSSYLTLCNVFCEFQEGVLTLRGCLPRYYLKQVAQEVVAELPGVEHVDNQIEVLPVHRREMAGSAGQW